MAEPSIHASALVVGSTGLLLRGPSGSGKSMLGHHLIATHRAAGHHAQWVADDRVLLAHLNGRIIARPPAELAGLAEFRGLGVQTVDWCKRAVVDLIIDLTGPAERVPEAETLKLLADGPALPLLRVPPQNLATATILIDRALRL